MSAASDRLRSDAAAADVRWAEAVDHEDLLNPTEAAGLFEKQPDGEFRLKRRDYVASPEESAAYLEFKAAAIAVKAANLAAIAAAERFRTALQKLSEAAAP